MSVHKLIAGVLGLLVGTATAVAPCYADNPIRVLFLTK